MLPTSCGGGDSDREAFTRLEALRAWRTGEVECPALLACLYDAVSGAAAADRCAVRNRGR
jgi:hypothetical protein